MIRRKTAVDSESVQAMLQGLAKGGMIPFVTVVPDAESPEGIAALEYIEAHKTLLPEGYERMPVVDVLTRGRDLFRPDASLQDRKAALLLLAHHGDPEVHQLLKTYVAEADPELALFARMALDENRVWLRARQTNTQPPGSVTFLGGET